MAGLRGSLAPLDEWEVEAGGGRARQALTELTAADGRGEVAAVAGPAPAAGRIAEQIASRVRGVYGLKSTLAQLESHLAEPLADCLATDADGRPCIEAKTPLDLERDLRLRGAAGAVSGDG